MARSPHGLMEHDITHLGDLLKGLEKKGFLDSGYIGCHKRAEIQAIPFKDCCQTERMEEGIVNQ